MEITGISKSIDTQRLTSKKATLLGIGTRQYVKDVVYVNLNQNWRKIKVKGVYVDVINIYGHKHIKETHMLMLLPIVVSKGGVQIPVTINTLRDSIMPQQAKHQRGNADGPC